jgi:hypothetical protein
MEEVGLLVESGLSRSEAVRLVAGIHGVSRRRLYEMATRQKPEDGLGVDD